MPTRPRPAVRASGSRPMDDSTRAKLGGLGVVASRGTGHMAGIGRAGQSGLDRRLAAEAGIPDDLPREEYQARLDAARSAHFTRLAAARWSRPPRPRPSRSTPHGTREDETGEAGR